ncbi:MAG TPA: hypothetical protein VN669_10745 [Candidatus Acidoferrales bacterium]|nr:hypothetical protein [Candidatus Acidoferrales bacterium]
MAIVTVIETATMIATMGDMSTIRDTTEAITQGLTTTMKTGAGKAEMTAEITIATGAPEIAGVIATTMAPAADYD